MTITLVGLTYLMKQSFPVQIEMLGACIVAIVLKFCGCVLLRNNADILSFNRIKQLW